MKVEACVVTNSEIVIVRTDWIRHFETFESQVHAWNTYERQAQSRSYPGCLSRIELQSIFDLTSFVWVIWSHLRIHSGLNWSNSSQRSAFTWRITRHRAFMIVVNEVKIHSKMPITEAKDMPSIKPALIASGSQRVHSVVLTHQRHQCQTVAAFSSIRDTRDWQSSFDL